MNLIKRTILFFAMIVICILMLSATAFAAEIVETGSCGTNNSNVDWAVDSNGTMYITGTGAMGDLSYEHKSQINNVIISDGVTSISNFAFMSYSNLEKVSLADSVKSIGISAFENCRKLSSISLPDGITSFGDGTFSMCESLSKITLPNSLRSLGTDTFYSCDSLTSITIPDSVTSIGDGAFFYCDSLASVTLGKSVSTIRSEAFYRCDMLVEVINRSRLSIKAGDPGNGYLVRYAKTVHTGESLLKNVDGFTFFTFDGVNYLMGAAADKKPCLVLPDYYNGEPYEVYKNAFIFDTDIVSVTVGEGVTALGEDLKKARANAYEAVKLVDFEGAYCRSDIGKAIDEA